MNALPKLNEKQFQAQVVEAARLYGWWVYHTYDARKSEPGFPDLVLIRPPELLFWELKTDSGKLTTAQTAVLQKLIACGERAEVMRPSDWSRIEQRLKRLR